jgi:hypothetical protein
VTCEVQSQLQIWMEFKAERYLAFHQRVQSSDLGSRFNFRFLVPSVYFLSIPL